MDIIEKPIVCRSCLKPFYPGEYRKLMEKEIILCEECLQGVEVLLKKEKFHGVEILYLSTYSKKIKEWLKYYKEYRDVALAPCFLAPFRLSLKCFAFSSVFVPCPSTKKREQERGFSTLSLMLESQGFPVLNCLAKEKEEEQKGKRFLQRFDSQSIVLEDSKCFEGISQIVLFDDVMTTGETFYQSYLCLRKYYSGKIKGVILAKNDKGREMEI